MSLTNHHVIVLYLQGVALNQNTPRLTKFCQKW